VLNTKDNAFGCFLAGLAGEDMPLQPAGNKWTNAGVVSGSKRTVAWRVLDAQYFGLAQRRKRVFVVASARDGFDPGAVLFEFDGLRRDTAPSRKAGKEVTELAGTLAANGGVLNRPAGNTNELDFCVTTFNKQRIGEYSEEDVSSTCAACDYKDATDLVAYGIQSTVIGRKPENGPQGNGYSEEISFTQTKTDVHGVCCVHGTQDPCTSETTAFALGRNNGGENAVLNKAMAVRRLTPTECERLQGFPDSYTKIPWRNKPAEDCPDGPRYKALGNSWAVPVIRWIGKRINNHVS
jgi:DNA (cytosine-5)-methyltransferase 1